MGDLPDEFKAVLIDTNDPFGPMGAKSVSEISCNGAAPGYCRRHSRCRGRLDSQLALHAGKDPAGAGATSTGGEVIRGILLAAGASRRMGVDKLGLPWRGTTVLEATLGRWTEVREIREVLLVRRSHHPEESRSGVRYLENPDADEGMGSSLRVAAKALPADTEAVVVGLADMPEVTSTTIRRLVEAWRPLGPRGIVAPVFRGKRGHPVVFGAHHIPALRALGGDSGGRTILKEHAGDLVLLPVEDPGVLVDLDTPADLEVQP